MSGSTQPVCNQCGSHDLLRPGIGEFADCSYCRKCWASWRAENAIFAHVEPAGRHFDFVEVGTSDWGTLTQFCAGVTSGRDASQLGTEIRTSLPDLRQARGLAVEAVQGLLDDLPNLPRITKVCAAMNEHDGGWEQFWSVPHKFIGRHMGEYKVEYPENDCMDAYKVDVMWYAKSLGCLGKPHPDLYDMLRQCGRLDLLRSRWVPVLSWGRLCEKYNVSSVDVVQLDCEGMDAAIVRGLAKHCERNAAAWPRVIQFEANHLTPNEEVTGTVAMLKKNGYRVNYQSRFNILLERF